MSNLAPTRMNLLRASRRLERVRHGMALLRRKREALVTELFAIARPAADARAAIDAQTSRAWPALLAALADHGVDGLRATGWPSRELPVTLRDASVWGIPAPSLEERPSVTRDLAARGTAPGAAGPAAVAAADAFERLTEILLDAAPREMLLRRLGEALAQTSRQVNTLEQRVAPRLRSQIATVRRTLDEREREERLRLKHVAGRQGP